jgi:hypothetical protein
MFDLRSDQTKFVSGKDTCAMMADINIDARGKCYDFAFAWCANCVKPDDIDVFRWLLAAAWRFATNVLAQHETEGVGEDGSAARRDAAGGEEDDDVGESGTDPARSAFLVAEDFVEKVGGVVEEVSGFASKGGVAKTEAGRRVLDGESAASAGALTAVAARGGARSGDGIG